MTRTTNFSLLSRFLLGLALSIGFALIVSSCDIEATVDGPATGSVYVTATTSGGDPIEGAAISLDGGSTNLTTPDTLHDVSVGEHQISLFKLGYLETTQSVTVSANAVASVSLTLEVASGGTIILDNMPESTVLLVNNRPYDDGEVPANEFNDVGFGMFEISAYLPESATSLPARWRVELSESVPIVTIFPTFTEATTGHEAGDLAPIFNLPSLADSSSFDLSYYRGRVVFVSFFFYSCAPCLLEFPEIQEVYENPALAGKVEFFGVDGIDSWQVFRRYLQDHPQLGLEFPLLHDQSQQIRAAAYNVTAHPTNFLIDQTGVIRQRWGSVTEELLLEAILGLLAEAE